MVTCLGNMTHVPSCVQGVDADSDVDFASPLNGIREAGSTGQGSAVDPASCKSRTSSMGMPMLLQARPTPPPAGVSRTGLGAGISTQHFQTADMERLRKTAGKESFLKAASDKWPELQLCRASDPRTQDMHQLSRLMRTSRAMRRRDYSIRY